MNDTVSRKSLRTLTVPGVALILAWCALLLTAASLPQEADPVETRFVRVHLRNGNVVDAEAVRGTGPIVTLVLKTGDLQVRRDAIERIESMTARTWIPKPPPPAKVEAPPQAAPEAGSEEVRRRIAEILSRIRGTPELRRQAYVKELADAAKPAVAELARALETVTPDLRPYVAAALIERKEAATIAALTPFLRSKRSEIREEAVRILGFLGDPSVTPLLAPLLQDGSPAVRSAALEGLMQLGTRQAFRIVATCCSDPNRDVRTRALQALPALAEKHDAWHELVSAWLDAFDRCGGEVKADVIAAIGVSGRVELVRYLVEALRDESPRVRAAVITALANLRARDRMDLIVERFTREEDPQVRIALAGAAQALILQDAIEPLISWLTGSDPAVAMAALRALQTISQRNFPNDPAAWTAWWQSVKPR